MSPIYTYTMNENSDRLLVLLYKIGYVAECKSNSSFISTESHQQILPGYEYLVTSLQITSSISPILFQVIKFLSGLS